MCREKEVKGNTQLASECKASCYKTEWQTLCRTIRPKSTTPCTISDIFSKFDAYFSRIQTGCKIMEPISLPKNKKMKRLTNWQWKVEDYLSLI